VFPFRSILNSSSVHLSASLGVPVILPGASHLVQRFSGEPWVRFFDVADAVESLADLLTEPDSFDHAASMEAFSRRYSPWNISQRYADLLVELTA
jgi:beta-1,4-mannosyltransferase